MVSITATTGANVQGQLLARNGAVTLDSNIINNGICDTATPVPPVTTTNSAVTTVSAITTTPAITAPVVGTTVNGGQLPNTSGNLYSLLFLGAALILMGGLGLQFKKKHENL